MSTNPCPNCGFSNRSSARFCSSCGEPLLGDLPEGLNNSPDIVALPTGTNLQDRYTIENELGRGGFGAVYRAWDTRLNKACAVKENLEVSIEAQRQFSREATVLAGLTHPNLPRVTDHFSIPDTGQYLVMDFVEGDDLASLVQREGRLPVNRALKWIQQVADALVYLHTRKPPVVHRDIKPANIRITPDDQAVLVDFGLVKLYDPKLRTTIGARAITPGYAPPEQYGRGGSTDVRSDIYALGATLYTLLTGKEPLESVQRLSGQQMPSASQLNPAVDPNVSLAIEKAMALDPEARFQTAAQFKAALAAPVATMVVEPLRPPQASLDVAVERPAQRGYAPDRAPSTPQPKRKTGRIMLGVFAVLLILCLGVSGLVGWWALSDGNQEDLDATARVLSVNQTATAFSNTLATKTAAADQRSVTATVQADQVGQTATAEIATAQAVQSAQTATVMANQTAQAYQSPLDAARGWNVVMEDYFFENTHDWATGEKDGSYAKINWTLGDGIYRWVTHAYDGFVWWVYPELDPVSDFYLSAEMRLISGPGTAESGLMFWNTDEGAYHLFDIDNQGQFAAFYYDSTEWTTLADWTNTPTLITDATNRLEVVAQGDNVLLYINGQFVSALFVADPPSGSAGLIVGLDENGEEATWEFYNFILRTP